MTYLDKYKRIYEDWIMSNLDTEYSIQCNENQPNVADSSRYLSELFSVEPFILNNKNQIFGNEETHKYLTSNLKDNDLPYRRLLKTDIKVIVQAGLHPVSEAEFPIYDTKKNFFDKFLEPNVVKKMRNGTLILLLYQGWEAENFEDEMYSRLKKDKYKNFYQMFKDVLDEYKLPRSSMIIVSSNLYGNEHKDYGVNVIYDNIMEWNTLHRGIAPSYQDKMLEKTGLDFKSINLDYSVDEYLESIKNIKTPLCRLSRTKHIQRDWMLYFIKKFGWYDRSVVEQKFFNEGSIIWENTTRRTAMELCEKTKELKYLTKYFELIEDDSVFGEIKKSLPIIASNYEKHPNFESWEIHSNLPIPMEVYKRSVFSWVSTSLPDQADMIFLNQSTFNPILYYHPIIWLSYPNTTKYFKKYGYKSYDWLFESESKIDDSEMFSHRLVYNLHDINKVMNMSNDELYNKIKDNKDTLVHNRNLLLECRSIERIITKLYRMIYETTI